MQLTLFMGVGFMNTLIDVILFSLLTGIVGMASLPAHVLSFSAGALNSFLANGSMTFQRRFSQMLNVRTAAAFSAAIVAQLAVTTVVLAAVLHMSASTPLAKAFSIAAGLGVSFILARRAFR